MTKLTIGIIIFCIASGIIFSQYQILMQKIAELDKKSADFAKFQRDSILPDYHKVVAVKAIPHGAIILSTDLGIQDAYKVRKGKFRKKSEVVGMRATEDISIYQDISSDMVEPVPLP